MNLDHDLNQVRRTLLRQYLLTEQEQGRPVEKDEYRHKRQEVRQLLEDLQTQPVEAHPYVKEVVTQMLPALESAAPHLQNMAVVPLGSLSTDAWKIKDVLNPGYVQTKHAQDFDWAILFDLPKDTPFPSAAALHETANTVCGTAQERRSLAEIADTVSANTLRSCAIYSPKQMGCLFNLPSADVAQNILTDILHDSVHNPEPSPTREHFFYLIATWLRPSFPPRVNQDNQEKFFLALESFTPSEKSLLKQKILSFLYESAFAVKRKHLAFGHTLSTVQAGGIQLLNPSDAEARQDGLLEEAVLRIKNHIIIPKIRQMLAPMNPPP